jgi:hypothetical protein
MKLIGLTGPRGVGVLGCVVGRVVVGCVVVGPRFDILIVPPILE